MVVCDGEVFVCRCRNVWLSCFSQAHLLPHYIFFINSWESLYSLTSRSGVLLQSCRLPKFQSSGIYFPEIDLQFLSKCMPCPHLKHFWLWNPSFRFLCLQLWRLPWSSTGVATPFLFFDTLLKDICCWQLYTKLLFSFHIIQLVLFQIENITTIIY